MFSDTPPTLGSVAKKSHAPKLRAFTCIRHTIPQYRPQDLLSKGMFLIYHPAL